MATGSDNQFPKLILEEVATDGSATVTPAADHRALFLGEDGALYAKDSAAAVTALGSGIPATIFDAAGDLIVASAADTAARLAAGSEDDVLTIASGVPAWAPAVGGGVSDALMARIVSSGGFLHYVAGRYYQGFLPASIPGTAGVSTAGTLFFTPFYVHETHTFDRIGLLVTTLLAASTARMGIYDSDANGLPDALVLDAGTVSTATTGQKDITISQSLTADTMYWLAVEASDAGTLRFAHWGVTFGNIGRPELSATFSTTPLRSVAHAYGALPNPAGSTIIHDAAGASNQTQAIAAVLRA